MEYFDVDKFLKVYLKRNINIETKHLSGLNRYFKMILNEEQLFLDSYIDFVNSRREEGTKEILVIRDRHLYYRKPNTNSLIPIEGDNFGLLSNQKNTLSFIFGGTVDKTLWDKWFNKDYQIVDYNLKNLLSKDDDFMNWKTNNEPEYGIS
jgi:hypothetical protein